MDSCKRSQEWTQSDQAHWPELSPHPGELHSHWYACPSRRGWRDSGPGFGTNPVKTDFCAGEPVMVCKYVEWSMAFGF